MDSDAHIVWDRNGTEYINMQPIVIGDKVWVAANCTLLKGTVIASNSLLNRSYLISNRIIGGIPARELKEIGGWRL